MSMGSRLARLVREAGRAAPSTRPAGWTDWDALYRLQAGRPVTPEGREMWRWAYAARPDVPDPVEGLIRNPTPPSDRTEAACVGPGETMVPSFGRLVPAGGPSGGVVRCVE